MQDPWILGIGLAALTLLSEDAALLGAAAAAAHGQLSWLGAFAAAASGIAAGDLGLYALGHWGRARLRALPWLGPKLTAERLERSRARLQEHGLAWVLASRVLPGTRLPGYTAAGILGVPFARFAGAVCLSCALWVGAVLTLSARGASQWGAIAAIGGLALLLLLIQALGAIPQQRWLRWAGRLRRWAHPEFWPPWLFYFPVALHYLRLSVRYGHPLLPSAANPAIPGGGLINESKDEIFALLPRGPHKLKHRLLQAGSSPAQARQTLRKLGLRYPVIAKPDHGQRGSGVRLIKNAAQLDAYALAMHEDWLLQAYSPGPHEAGIFYVRRPGHRRGFLFSITDKRFPVLQGDGRSTLAELILRHPRYRLQAETFLQRHRARLDSIPTRGQAVVLAAAGNHCQGTLFLNGRRLAGRGLRQALDRMAERMPGFHLGRFDIRYRDAAALRKGRGFAIVELNLGGAEATHVYDPGLSLHSAWRALCLQWSLLFERGAYERAHGAALLSVPSFLRDARAYAAAAKQRGGTD